MGFEVKRSILAGLAALSLAATAVLPASAQDMSKYPEQTVNFIVQSAAGGGSDLFLRTLAANLEKLGIVPAGKTLVENRPGGGGVVAYSYVAEQRGKPYFFSTGGGQFYTSPLLGNSPLDPLKDFTPIAAVAEDLHVMVVRAESDIKSLEDIKSRPSVTVGSSGAIADPRFLASMLQDAMKVEFRVVPFDSDGEVTAALLGGHVDIQFGNPAEVLPQIKAGALRPLAVTSPEKFAGLPDVPSLKEAGYDIELSTFRGVFMPADMPPEVVAFWDDAFAKLAQSKEWQEEYVQKYSLSPHYLNSAEYAKHMQERHALYEKLLRDAGLLK